MKIPLDAQTWYADNDNDGFGDATATWIECFAPNGYVADSNDCDDTVSHVNPNAQEVCDGLDNDCDGTFHRLKWTMMVMMRSVHQEGWMARGTDHRWW